MLIVGLLVVAYVTVKALRSLDRSCQNTAALHQAYKRVAPAGAPTDSA